MSQDNQPTGPPEPKFRDPRPAPIPGATPGPAPHERYKHSLPTLHWLAYYRLIGDYAKQGMNLDQIHKMLIEDGRRIGAGITKARIEASARRADAAVERVEAREREGGDHA